MASSAGAETLSQGEAPPLLAFAGVPVASVGFEISVPFSQREFAELIAIRAGDPLRPAAVREAILTLFRTGRFDQVEVRGRRVSADGKDGVELVFVLSPRKTLRRFRFTGNLLLPDSDLSQRLQLRRAGKVDDRALEDARKRLEEYYAYRGFPGATVEASYRFVGESAEIEAVFAIREGVRLRLGEVLLEGDPPMGRAAVLSLIGSRLGDPFDGQQADEDVKTLTAQLKRQGYYFCKVSSAVDRGSPLRGAILSFRVEKGERTRFEIAGAKAISAGDLLDDIRQTYLSVNDPAVAASLSVARVRDRYHAKGFPFANPEWKETVSGGERLGVLSLGEGQEARVGKVSVEGAHSLAAEEVLDTLALPEGAPYSRAKVEEGVRKLDLLYRTRGFLSQRSALRPILFREKGGILLADINISVEEGPRTVIAQLTLTGGEGAAAAGSLESDLGLKVGDPYVRESVARGKEALLQRMGNSGYLYAKVTAGEAFADSGRKALIDIKIEPGPQVRAGPILVTGTQNLSPAIVRLAADLPRGEVVTRESILEVQKRLYRLGVMESVEVSLADEPQPSEVKSLVVDVRERNRFVVGLRFGYSNEELLNGEVSFIHRNVGGMARNLTLLGRAGDKSSLASATYTIPWFLDRPMDLSFSLSDQVDRKESYTRDAARIGVNLRRQVSDFTVFNLTYSYGSIRLSDVAPVAVLSPEDEGKTTIGAVTPEWTFDGRDDKFEPTRGHTADIRLEVASPLLGSETEYYRLDGGVRRFLPLGEKTVLGLEARGGVVQSFGESAEVIIDKRFFLGGQSTVRGYSLDTLGPLDSQGKPLGGNYFVNLKGELRFPIYRYLGGVVFVDLGSVWLDAAPYDDATPRVTGGAGLRWATPIGPFSLDYGHKLNPATDTEDQWAIHFSIGHAF